MLLYLRQNFEKMGARTKLSTKEYKLRIRSGKRNNLLKRSNSNSFIRPEAFNFDNEEEVKAETPAEVEEVTETKEEN